MNDDTLKRFNRIVAILTQLQSKKIVKAQDLAYRFEVSLRTIYRDIRSLEKAGVPIISEAGVGYSIMDGYRLPPVMFNKEEALSLITAEKLMQKFTDKSIGVQYKSAMIKIRSVLRSTEKEVITHVENQIDIRAVNKTKDYNTENSLRLILESIAEKKQIILEYKAVSDEITDRTIEPVGVFFENNHWYLLGYCLLRQDYRQFRTDRIINIDKTYVDFSQKYGDLSEYSTGYMSCPKVKIRLLVDKRIAKYIINSKTAYGFIEEKEVEERIEMTFMTSEIREGFPRWYLSFADYACIIEPEELKNNVKKLVTSINQKLAE